MANHNPLSGYFRAPKLYTKIPSQGKFYSPDVIDMPETGELAIFPMTAKDETVMKNPDALLNGEAIAQVISSCVPGVKKPRMLLGNDVDALLVAIQGATQGDDIEVKGNCPVCKKEASGIASVEAALESMSVLEQTYQFVTDHGLTIEVRPFTYNSSVKAGIANFQSTRSLQSLSKITDELEQLKAFNESFVRMAALNFDLIVDSIARISGVGQDSEQFVVSDRDQIREFMENCESSVGKGVEKYIEEVNKIGVNKKVQLECEEHGPFEVEVGFDPVNFFTAS
jgi:hypothetical protein